jgi:ABC-type bacteriocin/lantibiotic exporter with double-glycine peptidase domain
MQSQARILGEKEAEISVHTNQLLFEALNSYREIYVKGLRKSYADRISQNKFELSSILAKMSFLPSVSKYVIESSILVGALLVSTVQFMQYDAQHSIATLTVFLAAGSRISPAVLRVQQGLISIKNNLGGAQTALKLVNQLQSNRLPIIGSAPLFKHTNFDPEVVIRDVKFKYAELDTFQMGPINLKLKAGTVVAIVGASGSGKTTLADLILGAIYPTSGFVQISGKDPSETIMMSPGAMAYVPQDIQIFKGDVIANIAFGYEFDESFLPAIQSALETAQLTEVITELPNGLHTELGDKGFRLSGGQRQRLGIARALFTSPKLIVLDEATSALDGKTEDEISTAISKLKGETTVILIAHRLASVRNADVVIYLADGRVVAQGTFEEIKRDVPDFAQQAKLMGL